jgi:uncharacterized protein (DUF697 family)
MSGSARSPGEPVPFADAILTVNGVQRKMSALELVGTYENNLDVEKARSTSYRCVGLMHGQRATPYGKKGFFANQNSACKLRSKFTLEELVKRFQLED